MVESSLPAAHWGEQFLTAPSWTALAELPERQRDQRILLTMARLAEKPPGQRGAALRQLLLAELELHDAALEQLTLGRCRVWAALDDAGVREFTNEALAVEYRFIPGPDATRVRRAYAQAAEELSVDDAARFERAAPAFLVRDGAKREAKRVGALRRLMGRS